MKIKFGLVLCIWLVGVFWGRVGNVWAGCSGTWWNSDSEGSGLCIENECHTFKWGNASIMCNGVSKTLNGFCGGTCAVGAKCDFGAYSCNFCGSCENEMWCGTCGGGVSIGKSESVSKSNVWIRVLERGGDGKVVAWKGNNEDNNDSIWMPTYYDRWEGVNSKSLLPRWSVDPDLGGGMNGNGDYLKYWPAFGGSGDSNVWKNWDVERNKISDQMNLVVDQVLAPFNNKGQVNGIVGAREYWSNHFCTGGIVGGMSSEGKWPLYNGDNNSEFQTCTRWEEDCSGGMCTRWCRGDVDGCWSNWETSNDDSYDYYYQLDKVRKFAEVQEDTDWMDLRYDGYWSLSYAASSLRADGVKHEIKLIPPEGKVCKDVRWFTGGDKPSERKIELGNMEFARDDQGVCSIGNFEYSEEGNLIILEVESAQEAPTLEVDSKCSLDGKEMTMVIRPNEGTDRVSVMGNRGGVDDVWIPGNNKQGPGDFLISDEGVSGGVNKVLNISVDPDIPYAISVMPCGVGEQFPCKGKVLSFRATCSVNDQPKWTITAQAMCVSPESGKLSEPVYFPGSATKYSVSDNIGVVTSKLGNNRFYTFELDGQTNVDYKLKFEAGERLQPVRVSQINGSSVKINAKDEYIWNSETKLSGIYTVDYEAPKNWCVPKKTWNIIPRVDCGEGNLAYLPIDFGYSLESGQSTVQGYTNCPRYQIVESRGFSSEIDANVRIEGVEYQLKPMKLVKCNSLSSCVGNIVGSNYEISGSKVEIKDSLGQGIYQAWFEMPSELRVKVCGPQLITGLDKSCSGVSANPVILDSDKKN